MKWKTWAPNWNNLNVIWIRYSLCRVVFSQSPGKIPNGRYNLILSTYSSCMPQQSKGYFSFGLCSPRTSSLNSKVLIIYLHQASSTVFCLFDKSNWPFHQNIGLQPHYPIWAVLLGHSVSLREHLGLTWCPVWTSWGLRYCYLSPRLLSLLVYQPTNMWWYLFSTSLDVITTPWTRSKMLIPHFNSFSDPYLPSPVPYDQGNSQSRIKANPFSPDWENPLQRLSNEGMVGLHITV